MKRRGHAGRIVVRVDDPLHRLDQVDAEEERLAGSRPIGERTEECPPLLDEQVADRAAEEGDEPPAIPSAGGGGVG